MMKKNTLGICAAGFLAGTVNGLFGAGGGMVLVPLLSAWTPLDEDEVFPASVSIIAPICIVSLVISAVNTQFQWGSALPYLLGSAIGGIAAGFWGCRLPVKWLHRILGILILWGGVRYLC